MSVADSGVTRARGLMRSDVRRNRVALLAAARHLFATDGDVAMYEIAKLAGVGEATLYRHFPERVDLAAAVLEEIIADQERLAAELSGEADAFFRLLSSTVDSSSDALVFSRMLRASARSRERHAELKDQILGVFAGPLREAQRAGLVRPDLRLDDVLLMLRMMLGAIDDAVPEPKPDASTRERILELLVHGVRAPDAPSANHQVVTGIERVESV